MPNCALGYNTVRSLLASNSISFYANCHAKHVIQLHHMTSCKLYNNGMAWHCSAEAGRAHVMQALSRVMAALVCCRGVTVIPLCQSTNI